MVSKSASVIGPLVPSPTTTSSPSCSLGLHAPQDGFTLRPLAAHSGVDQDAGDVSREGVPVVDHDRVPDSGHPRYRRRGEAGVP